MKRALIFICLVASIGAIFSNVLLNNKNFQKLENLDFTHTPSLEDKIFSAVQNTFDKESLFNTFCKLYNKDYSIDTELGKKKFELFKEKLNLIKKFNESHNGAATFGVYPEMLDDEDESTIRIKQEQKDIMTKLFANAVEEDIDPKSQIDSNSNNSSGNKKFFDFDSMADEDDMLEQASVVNTVSGKKSSKQRILKQVQQLNPVDYREIIPFDFSKNKWIYNGINALVHVVEAANFLKTKKYVKLSQFQASFCSSKRKYGMLLQFWGGYLHEFGLYSYADYGEDFFNYKNKCKEDVMSPNAIRYKLDRVDESSDYFPNPKVNYVLSTQDIYTRLLQSPLYVSMTISRDMIYSTKTGIITPDLTCKGGCYASGDCWPNEDVAIVGYGVDQTTNTPYWIILPGVATSNGEKGYLRVKVDESTKNWGMGCHTTGVPTGF